MSEKKKFFKEFKIDPKCTAKLVAETFLIVGRRANTETVRNITIEAGYKSEIGRKKIFTNIQNPKRV